MSSSGRRDREVNYRCFFGGAAWDPAGFASCEATPQSFGLAARFKQARCSGVVSSLLLAFAAKWMYDCAPERAVIAVSPRQFTLAEATSGMASANANAQSLDFMTSPLPPIAACLRTADRSALD